MEDLQGSRTDNGAPWCLSKIQQSVLRHRNTISVLTSGIEEVISSVWSPTSIGIKWCTFSLVIVQSWMILPHQTQYKTLDLLQNWFDHHPTIYYGGNLHVSYFLFQKEENYFISSYVDNLWFRGASFLLASFKISMFNTFHFDQISNQDFHIKIHIIGAQRGVAGKNEFPIRLNTRRGIGPFRLVKYVTTHLSVYVYRSHNIATMARYRIFRSHFPSSSSHFGLLDDGADALSRLPTDR